MPIKNFYWTPPGDLEDGDVFVAIVTCHMQVDQENRTVGIRVYRCDYPNPETYEGIPQGCPSYGDQVKIAKALFPVLCNFDTIVELD